MTSHITNDEPPPATGQRPGPEPIAPGSPPWPRRTERRGRRALIVTGVILAFLGIWTVAGGTRAAIAYQDRDFTGYYTTGSEPFATDSYALASAPEFTGIGPDLLYAREVLGTIRISGESSASGTPLFIGIGPADDVAAYLGDVGHDEVSDIDVSPFSADYDAQPGGAPADVPTAQTFWTASVSGAGTQTLISDLPAGEWSVVVMNADGSAGVDTHLSVGATLPVIGWVAVGALVTGGALIVVGITLTALGVRRRA